MSLSFVTTASDYFTNFSTNFSKFEQLKRNLLIGQKQVFCILNEVEKRIIINMHEIKKIAGLEFEIGESIWWICYWFRHFPLQSLPFFWPIVFFSQIGLQHECFKKFPACQFTFKAQLRLCCLINAVFNCNPILTFNRIIFEGLSSFGLVIWWSLNVEYLFWCILFYLLLLKTEKNRLKGQG